MAALVFASVAVFVVSRAMPSTPMEMYLQSQGLPVTPENVAALRHQWGLDGPLLSQYWQWITDLLRGDWGMSAVAKVPIGPQLSSRIPISLTIGFGALVIALLIAYLVGMCAAVYGGWWERSSRALAVFAQAVPPFVVAVLLINLLGVSWRWVPFYSLTGPAAAVAPTLILAVFTAGQLVRVVATHGRELADEPFVAADMGRGFSRSRVLWSHGRRQVVYGLVSASVAKMAMVIGGAAILEFVFAVPGMSTYLIESIQHRDYLVIQAYLMLMAAWMAASHIVLGLALAWLDPRTRR